MPKIRSAPKQRKPLNISQPEALGKFESIFNEWVVGQPEAGRIFTQICGRIKAGNYDPKRTRANVMMLGPTGVGKTKSMKEFAYRMTGSYEKLLKIECESMLDEHYASMVVGSPVGYIGCDVQSPHHEAIEPLLSQRNVDEHGGGDPFVSPVLFDEFEKGGPVISRILMTPTEEGHVRLGTGKLTNMTRTVIGMTSNIGAVEMERALNGRIGFAVEKNRVTQEDLQQMKSIAIKALEKQYSPEFRNRIDYVIVYLPLDQVQMAKVLELELIALQQNLLQNNPLAPIFSCGINLKRYLSQEGFSKQYGARFMRRTVNIILSDPLSNLIINGGFNPETDHILFDIKNGRICSYIENSVSPATNNMIREKLIQSLVPLPPATPTPSGEPTRRKEKHNIPEGLKQAMRALNMTIDD